MGRPEDPNGVVDSRGRVFGVKRLRVIDVSAFVRVLSSIKLF